MKHTNMKYNESYVVKNLADEIVLVHQDEYNVDCSKIITLNEVALFIIDRIKEGLNDDQKLVESLQYWVGLWYGEGRTIIDLDDNVIYSKVDYSDEINKIYGRSNN